MSTATLSKPKTKTPDKFYPISEKVTLEEYISEMQAAENSGFISFEKHKQNMNQWLTSKL